MSFVTDAKSTHAKLQRDPTPVNVVQIDLSKRDALFLSLTRIYTPETRRLLARRIAVDSFVLLIASFAIGSHVLSFFGISLSVVQVGCDDLGCDGLGDAKAKARE